MTIRRVLTTALLLGTGLVGIVTITQGIESAYAQNAGQRQTAVLAQNRSLEEADEDGRGPRGNRRHGHRMARLCRHGGSGEHLEQMDALLDSNLDLSATQQDNWDAVLTAFDQSDLEAACESEDRETIRAAGQQLREPLQTFMSSLSDDQKEELRSLMHEQRDSYRSEQGRPDAN